MARSDHSDRDKRDRIERLRKRLDAIVIADVDATAKRLRDVLRGLLDLLADEL
jgi:hypothetical protein